MPARVAVQPAAVSPRRPATPELLSRADLDKALHNQLLPSSNKVAKAAAKLDARWADDNIMSGVAGTLSGKLPKKASAAELSKVATNLLQAGLEATDGTDDVRTRGTVSVRTGPVDERALQSLTKTTAADGFNYDTSNPENLRGMRQDVDALLKALTGGAATPRAAWGREAPATRDLQLVQASREVKVSDNDWRTATVSVFVNTKTNEFVGIYTRAGWD